MSSANFIKALSKRLYPLLRAEGFKGSGNTLRRINEPVVHVFNVQSGSGGQQCYLNLGAHLMFLSSDGNKTEASDLKEYECAFRDRFDPPWAPDLGWMTTLSPQELDDSISFICEHWKIFGQDFFNRYMTYPADFEKIVTQADLTSLHPNHLEMYSKIALQLGNANRAQVILVEALKRCPESATALRADLEQQLKKIK